MAELKTKPHAGSVDAFLDAIADEGRRADCRALCVLMQEVTGHEPVMWGPSIVGFGQYHYRYASGREADWFLTGFAPRKSDLTLYFNGGLHEHDTLLTRLGKHKMGKGCLYLKKLSDIDTAVLRDVITANSARLAALYPPV